MYVCISVISLLTYDQGTYYSYEFLYNDCHVYSNLILIDIIYSTPIFQDQIHNLYLLLVKAPP